MVDLAMVATFGVSRVLWGENYGAGYGEIGSGQ